MPNSVEISLVVPQSKKMFKSSRTANVYGQKLIALGHLSDLFDWFVYQINQAF